MHNTQNKIKKYFKAFTLVELIVVIVILAILATIAFLSFNSYSSNTRDSVRLSDINGISKSIELYFIKVGTYPNPDNSFNITYSGGNVWYQGIVGDNLFRKISFNINKKPIDPLNSSEYVYSLLSYGNFYQIKSNYEGDNVSFEKNGDIFNFDKTLAAPGNPRIAYIKGSYMGIVAKTVSGTTICILASPSIITNISGVSGSGYEIGNNTLSGTLLYHGQSSSSGIYFNPNKPVYCSGSLPSNDTNSGLTNIASGIINAYSGTVVTNLNSRIQQIVSTPSNSLSSLGSNIVGGHLGGSVSNSVDQTINSTNGLSSSNPGTTCYAIKTNYPASASGSYWIKPDTNPAFRVYCDMSIDGGGWTLVVGISSTSYTHVNASAVNASNLVSVSGKGKYSDIVINSIKRDRGDGKPVYRLTCNSTTGYFKSSCTFNSVIDAAGDCVAQSYAFNPPSYGTTKTSQSTITGLADGDSGYNNRLIYGLGGASLGGANGCDTTAGWAQNGTLYVR